MNGPREVVGEFMAKSIKLLSLCFHVHSSPGGRTARRPWGGGFASPLG